MPAPRDRDVSVTAPRNVRVGDDGVTLDLLEAGSAGLPPLLILVDRLEAAGWTDLAAALSDEFQVRVGCCTTRHGDGGADRLRDPWARDASTVAGWLASLMYEPGVHVVGTGEAVLSACMLALDRPDLVCSLTLCDPVMFLSGADAEFDPAVDLAAAPLVGSAVCPVFDPALNAAVDPEAAPQSMRRLQNRKAALAGVVERIRGAGVLRPVNVLFGAAVSARIGAATLEVFDLFAARQYHTELHVQSAMATGLAPALRALLAPSPMWRTVQEDA